MQKIKLNIANRIYPLNVPVEQEEGLRTASKKIELMIKHYEYHVPKIGEFETYAIVKEVLA